MPGAAFLAAPGIVITGRICRRPLHEEMCVPTLFDPVTIGDLTLPNRIAMAPMTRARVDGSGVPGDIVVEYYAQRATAGLIVTEGVFPSIEGKGYFDTPGIETEAQAAGWKRVTDAVHARGGRIYLQLMHCGRVGHPLNNPGVPSVAPSAIQADFQILTREQGMQRMGMPQALSTNEVRQLLDRFERAAENSKAAGFDGIELHAASGYLPNQFLASNTNRRDDAYGGTPEKRARFVIEALERLAKVFGPGRTAVKLAPRISYNDIDDETVDETYGHLLGVLDGMGLAYLHFQTTLSYVNLGRPMTQDGLGEIDLAEVYPYRYMRERFSGPIMAAGDLTLALAHQALDKGLADLFAFGRGFIANPDFAERLRSTAPIAVPALEHYYGGGAKGLIDYPAYAGS